MAKNLKLFPFNNLSNRAYSAFGWIVYSGAVVNTLAGNDTIKSVEIENFGSIYMGLGDDSIISNGTSSLYNDGIINTGDGNDIINGGSAGIWNYDGRINTGAGNDSITGSVFNESEIYTGLGHDTITSRTISGSGIYNKGRIYTSTGNDIISGFSVESYGISNYGFIDTGEGNDIINGSDIENNGSILLGEGLDKISCSIYQISGRIYMGAGDDSIVSSNGFFQVVETNPLDPNYRTASLLSLGDGHDSLIAPSITNGSSATVRSVIDTGIGNDRIILRNTSLGSSLANDGNVYTGLGNDYIFARQLDAGIGINNSGLISTGDGTDTLIAIGYSSEGVYNSETAKIDTGLGDDIFRSSSPDWHGFENRGKLSMSDGNDFLSCVSTAFNYYDGSYGSSLSIRSGLKNNGKIYTGAGNDIITARGRGADAAGYSINNSGLIDTGIGDDVINAVNGFRGAGTVKLGDGNDTIRGFGSGRFYGAEGIDKILLGTGIYSVSNGFITKANFIDDAKMLVNGIEQIGGINGGLFAMNNGMSIIVNSAGVAVTV